MSSKNSKPRVLIDASVITATSDGLSVYVINLLKYLPAESFEQFEFTVLYTPGLNRPDFFSAVEGRAFRFIEHKIAPIGPRRDWDWFRFLRQHAKEFDLVHITSSQYPLALRGGIATIHDVTFRHWFHNPGGVPGAGYLAVAYMTQVVSHCLRRAGRIIADSSATKREILSEFRPTPAQSSKVEVIHLGWEHLLDAKGGELQNVPYADQSYLYFLGTFRLHKNLPRLIEAFRLALDDIPVDKMLVISGDKSDRLSPAVSAMVADINSKGTRVYFTGYLSDADVEQHYKKADAFVFPSLMEGFGLPVLEAFHHGVPLLCSDRTSLPEIAGDAAIYFDPTDAHSIAAAIRSFFAQPSLREQLIEKGRDRLREFSWKMTAAKTVAVYREQAGIATPLGKLLA